MFAVWHLVLNLESLISLNLGRRKVNEYKDKNVVTEQKTVEGDPPLTKRLLFI